ncbi:MAG: secondary thiamine-phosphate synthase enzyme YjbQ [Pseudomonadota bacterium]
MMKVFTTEIDFSTNEPIELIDITKKIRKICKESGVNNGILSITTQHTTTSIIVNEKCEHLQKDMVNLLKDVVPEAEYHHDRQPADLRSNAHSHLMSMLLGSSVTIPVSEGTLEFGDWQSIFFIELDGPRAKRHVKIKVIGEKC